MFLTAITSIANDKLYIKDFDIETGETKTIALILDNDTAYSAFQTDIYLSNGLEIEQEDGEYIIDLNPERVARSHVVSTFKRDDGAIRILLDEESPSESDELEEICRSRAGCSPLWNVPS